MEIRYEVSILISEYVNDAANLGKCFDTYEEAVSYAKPLVDQGYCVVITAFTEWEEENESEFIEIPLDTYQYIEKLTEEQAGVVLKNIYAYFFDNTELNYEDFIVLDTTVKIIKRIKEYANE